MENDSNSNDISEHKSLSENDKLYNITNSIVNDKDKSADLIKNYSPDFSIKLIPSKTKIDKIFSLIEKIPPENMRLIKELRYEEEIYDSESIFETKLKSMGLSETNLDLSLKLFSRTNKLANNDFQYKKEKINMKNNVKKHCIHSIKVIFFRIIINEKDIKFNKGPMEIMEKMKNAKETERKKMLEDLVEEYGLYIPMELLVGGRINYSFEANSEEEVKEYNSLLQNEINIKLGGFLSFLTGKGHIVGGKIGGTDSNVNRNVEKIKNLNLFIEGGDMREKNDFRKWPLSLNMNNLQIIEYKTLIPIYSFIEGLAPKIEICFQEYDKIVLEEIKNLIDKEKEKELPSGDFNKSDQISIGITEEKYDSFMIYSKKKYKILEVTESSKNKENKVVINGNIPDGFIICGWRIKTNVHSQIEDVSCKWRREKEFSIIGSNSYKFIFEIESFQGSYIKINCNCEIFCIHQDFLIPLDSNKFNDNPNSHYFLNCDCCQSGYDKCYYLNFDENNNNWRKLDFEGYKRLQAKAEEKRKKKEEELLEKSDSKKGFFDSFLGLK